MAPRLATIAAALHVAPTTALVLAAIDEKPGAGLERALANRTAIVRGDQFGRGARHGPKRPLQIAAYRLGWEEEATSGELVVSLRKGKKLVASARGRWETLERARPHDSVVYLAGEAGAQRLLEIRFAGREQAIRLDLPSADTVASRND